VIAQIPVERLAGNIRHDLTECGEPVVAVHPPRPRLDVDGQAIAVVLAKRNDGAGRDARARAGVTEQV
jgi:hypothetical protein